MRKRVELTAMDVCRLCIEEGKKVFHNEEGHKDHYIYFDKGSGWLVRNSGGTKTREIANLLATTYWLEQEWYENIPEGGFLIYFNHGVRSGVYHVHSYEKRKQHVVTTGETRLHIDYCRKLTNEEIKAFLVEESSDDWRDSVSEENPVECFVSDGECILLVDDGDYSDYSKDNIIRFYKDISYSYKTRNDSYLHAIPVNPKLRIK